MKEKMTPHIIAVIALVVFIVLGLACANTPPPQIQAADSGGLVLQVQVEGKDFEPLGVIFLTSTATFRSGRMVEGSPVTYEMLMRAAVEMGADDIVNLRVDEIATRRGDATGNVEVITYHATALAIKYK